MVFNCTCRVYHNMSICKQLHMVPLMDRPAIMLTVNKPTVMNKNVTQNWDMRNK